MMQKFMLEEKMTDQSLIYYNKDLYILKFFIAIELSWIVQKLKSYPIITSVLKLSLHMVVQVS